MSSTLYRVQRFDRDDIPRASRIYSQKPAALRCAERWQHMPSTGRVQLTATTATWEPLPPPPAPEDPIVCATKVTTSRGRRHVTVVCPYCPTRRGKHRTHVHGWPQGSGDQPGHRLAHCGLGGYDIVVLEP